MEHARRLGADALVNAKQGDPVAAVKQATGGGAHGGLITALPLSAINHVFERLAHGEVPSRVVLDFAPR